MKEKDKSKITIYAAMALVVLMLFLSVFQSVQVSALEEEMNEMDVATEYPEEETTSTTQTGESQQESPGMVGGC